MPRGRHRDVDEDEPVPPSDGFIPNRVAPSDMYPQGEGAPLSPEAEAIASRKWRDSAAALRETARSLRGCGLNFLQKGVQPLEYLQMMSLPAGRLVERLFEAAAGLNFVNAILFQACVQIFFNPPASVLAHLKRPDTGTGKAAVAFVVLNGILVIIVGCNTTMVGWLTTHVASLRDDLIYRWLSRAKFVTLDKLSAVYVFCFVLVLVLVQIYAHLLFTDFGAKRVALVFNFTLSVAAVVLPAQYLRTMHRINPLYWMGYSGYSLLFFPFAGRTNLHQPHINSAVEYAEELAADMETIAARIDREAEQKAAVAASAPWASAPAERSAGAPGASTSAGGGAADPPAPAGPASSGHPAGPPLKERPWRDGVAALKQVAEELRDLSVNGLSSGMQPTFMVQMLALPKGRIVERIIESSTSLNFVNALLFSCVIQVFFALPQLILDALKGVIPYDASHNRLATAFVFLNGAAVVILGCTTTLVSWFTINVSVVKDDMIHRWLERARYSTIDKYNLLYVVSFYIIVLMVDIYGFLLLSTTGSPRVARAFCAVVTFLTVVLYSTFLRLTFRLNPFYWLGYSAFALLWFPFAGVRNPMHKESVSAAAEYARELARDLDDLAKVYEYEKLHEERLPKDHGHHHTTRHGHGVF